jgi:glutamine amidotransferase
MCRFVLYMGPETTLDVLTTRPSNSIIHQSFHSRLRKEPLNGDGFGIAWYVPDVSPDPAQFRSIQPAWNNVNLRHLARVCRSPVILAHVRAATNGTIVSEANCHPFIAGQFAFMHNGSVAAFNRIKREISQRLSDESYAWIQGTTDSEYLFALFCDNLHRFPNDDRTEAMANALEATIVEVSELAAKVRTADESFLNHLMTSPNGNLFRTTICC